MINEPFLNDLDIVTSQLDFGMEIKLKIIFIDDQR